MDLRRAPALLPAGVFLLGVALGFRLAWVSVPLLAGLGLAAVAWGRRAGLVLGCLAAGVGLPVVAGDAAAPRSAGTVSTGPVTVVGRVAGQWRRGRWGWTAPLSVERIRWRRGVAVLPLVVSLTVPGSGPPPPFGSRVRARGFLERSPGYRNAVPTPPGPWRLSLKSRRLLQLQAGGGALARLSTALRRQVELTFGRAESRGTGVALARALVLGDASRVPPGWKRGLRRLGLSHLLAVSGLHAGLAAGLALVAGGWLPRCLRLLTALAAVGLYLLVAGPRPSLLRASLMALLALGALLAERPPSAANALAWAALVPVLLRPATVGDLGYQLTVAATTGIVLLSPSLARRWTLPGKLSRPLAATVAAQLCVLPWSLPRFHLLVPAAALLNLVAVPWTALALAVCFAWTGAAVAVPELARPLSPLLDAVAVPFSWAGEARGALLWAVVPLAASGAGVWALGIALGLTARRFRPISLAGLMAVFSCQAGAPRADPGVVLTLLDVGQGDAILLRDGPRAVLVDGGGWEAGDFGGQVLLPALLGEGVRWLDAVVLTHPDRDHCGGLREIADSLPVGEVWTGPGWPAAGCAGGLALLPGVGLRVLWAGAEVTLGRWRFTALSPSPGDRGSDNDRSLVLAAEALGRRLLLTGDLGDVGEGRLLRRGAAALECDVLKVAHHGSKSSSGRDFLRAADPAFALLSVGRGNPYHHPSPEVVARLRRQGAPLLRTDLLGAVRLRILPDGSFRVFFPGAP